MYVILISILFLLFFLMLCALFISFYSAGILHDVTQYHNFSFVKSITIVFRDA
jgi:hypothetical protein